MTVTRERKSAASLAVCMLLPSLGTSIANVALPTLAAAFGTTSQHVQWVVLAYLLAVTSLIVSAGRLGDIMGRRSLLLIGIATFASGSALCGIAPSLGALIAARAMQGAGAALMMSMTMALAEPRAMGILGMMSAVGTALGPSMGGLLIATLGWRSVFLVKVPLAIAALMVTWRNVPNDVLEVPRVSRAFDTRGTLLLASTLIAYALTVTVTRGSLSPARVALFVTTIAGVALFVRSQASSAAPLVDLKALRNRTLATGLASSGLVSTVVMATLVVGPFYLTRALMLGPGAVGITMSTGPVVAALVSAPAGRFVARHGAPRVTTAGLYAVLLGASLLSLLPLRAGVAGYVISLVILTGGYAAFQTANNTGVMAAAGKTERGVVSGMLNLSRNLGLITGASVMSTIYSVASGAGGIGEPAAASASVGMRAAFGVAALLIVTVVAAQAWLGRPDHHSG